MTWHIISDQRVSDFFFAYVKMPKICKLQDAQKCWPRAEFGIWQDGSSNFHGRIRFWAFQLAILAGKAIFSTFPVAPPISVSEILEISKMIIRGEYFYKNSKLFRNRLWKLRNFSEKESQVFAIFSVLFTFTLLYF